jgi:hypothetical protein
MLQGNVSVRSLGQTKQLLQNGQDFSAQVGSLLIVGQQNISVVLGPASRS